MHPTVRGKRPNADLAVQFGHRAVSTLSYEELRIQHAGRPYRVLYAFDPRRVAILLIGGDKTGDDRWYEKYVPLADKIYDTHIVSLTKESKNHG